MTDLRFRDPELVVALLGYVYDADGPVPWLEVVYAFLDDRRTERTLENTIYDLVAFGALHRIGKPRRRHEPDTRALKATTLGRAWLDRQLVPLPSDPPDAFDEAEQIAHRHETDLAVAVHTLAPGTENPTLRPHGISP